MVHFYRHMTKYAHSCTEHSSGLSNRRLVCCGQEDSHSSPLHIAHSDLPMHRHHGTNLKSIEHDQLCLTPGKFRNKEQLIWSMSGPDRYQPTLFPRLLLLQKMLLAYNVVDVNRQLKTASADQQTLVAEDVTWQATRNYGHVSMPCYQHTAPWQSHLWGILAGPT